MTFKFFRSLLFSLLLASSLGAQTPAATPAPKKKPKEGYFRFWNFLPRDQGSLALMKSDAAAEGESLLTAAPYNYHAEYTAFPPTRYHLKVVRTTAPAEPLANFDVVLRDNVCVTFAASSAGGKLKVEMIDDTYSLETAPAGRLTIRQEQPGVQVSVTSNARQASSPLAPGAVQALDGLPLKSVAFEMKAVHPDGKAEYWSADIDFSKARRASLLVVPDPYGRFRPRVAIDGHLDLEEPAALPAPVPQ